ncbi:MAG: segregation/condensation protein A [Alphaproteobacteria bacterium]|nr:segregation/condensation protein A [Alphaproteobacteria bacterium]MDX5417141.1 segregation/condensation protein A [Alphaproteobacteria bacterium]MDX5494569.1 segregation/condensation protein A [Alphaproteobacteria bacterium]
MSGAPTESDADGGAQPNEAAMQHAVSGFEEGAPRDAIEPDENTLIVDLDGFEGPLDVLLMLARNQKVDLTKISILKLAEQYLDFITQAKRMELDLAADYLVMASWLAFLKSKLLLPPPEEEEGPSGAEMAARLAFQLQRLEAMRKAAVEIFARRNRMGIHVFPRGAPEGIRLIKTSEYQGTLFELLKSYSDQRLKGHETKWEPKRLPIMAIEAARHRLERMMGMMFDWGRIDSFMPMDDMSPAMRRSAVASTFSAALVLAKDGLMEIRQSGAFGPVFVRRREPNPDQPPADTDGEPEKTEDE